MIGTTRNTITRSEFERILAYGIEVVTRNEYEDVYHAGEFGMRVRFSPESAKRNADAIFGKQETK